MDRRDLKISLTVRRLMLVNNLCCWLRFVYFWTFGHELATSHWIMISHTFWNSNKFSTSKWIIQCQLSQWIRLRLLIAAVRSVSSVYSFVGPLLEEIIPDITVRMIPGNMFLALPAVVLFLSLLQGKLNVGAKPIPYLHFYARVDGWMN